MTAGTASTVRAEVAPQAHATDSTLPFKPRNLTRSERNRREIFVFDSPKNNRIVTVATILHVAIALRFEFDPLLIAYVERPRRMALSDKQEIDISFWTRSRAGEEHYHLAIPTAGTIGSTSGTVSIRNRDALDEAASRHNVELRYVSEREVISDLATCATAFELLPHVWAYRSLHSRSIIRDRILQHLANACRTTLDQLFSLIEFPRDSIRAVVAAMVHDGSLTLVDYMSGSADVTLEVRRA